MTGAGTRSPTRIADDGVAMPVETVWEGPQPKSGRESLTFRTSRTWAPAQGAALAVAVTYPHRACLFLRKRRQNGNLSLRAVVRSK